MTDDPSTSRPRQVAALAALAARRLAAVARGQASPAAFTWIEPGRLAAARYPRDDAALAALAGQGIVLLVNLHERAHPPAALARHGLTELHLPTRDFTAPTPADLATGVAAIEAAGAAGRPVAVHCGAGLGRTGTLVACALTRHGLTAEAAIARVRALRPGSVETPAQVAAVVTFAALPHADG
jgi:atypical dual specificity phosphatase